MLAARSSTWSHEQLDALLSPTSFTAALLPRHLLHATIQKRLGQRLGTPRSDADRSASEKNAAPLREACLRECDAQADQEPPEDAR